MAVTTLTHTYEKITVPANTSEHTINFDNMLDSAAVDAVIGNALIKRVSGTAVQFDSGGVAIDSNSASLQSDDDRLILPIRKGIPIRYKGGAGSEVFSITILRD